MGWYPIYHHPNPSMTFPQQPLIKFECDMGVFHQEDSSQLP